MGTKRDLFYVSNSAYQGDVALEPFPEMTSEIIIGQDARSTPDQALAFREATNQLFQHKENLDELTPELSMPYAPAEPRAASLIEEIPYVCYGSKVDAYDEFADGCRIFVWRNSQWHPISATQLEQIQTSLETGQKAFKVSDGTSTWTVDATRKNEWFQVSPGGMRRELRCTPTIFTDEDSQMNFIDRITAEWRDIASTSVGTSGVELDDFVSAYRSKSSNDDIELLNHTFERLYKWMNHPPQSPMTVVKWIHVRLLETQAPSMHAIHQINRRLEAWTTRHSKILDCFIELFLQACKDRVSMRLTIPQMQFAMKLWSMEASSAMFTATYREHLESLINCESAYAEGESITYYEFLNYLTGQSWSTVELYFYDLTKGSGWWWTPVLLGQSMPSLWHCGVVVFDKEYRYGGNIFESNPGCTAFGKPFKTIKLGETCRTRQDLLSFVNRHLSHQFAVDNYQVLSNNSNHFCDALCMFLLNKHISQEVLQQPEMIMSGKVVQSLSKWLPWLKGLPAKEGKLTVKVHSEWETIEADSFVSYEYEDGWTLVARVLEKTEYSCDLRWYSRQDNKFHVRRGVSRQAVQPLFGVGDPLHNRCLPQRKL